MSSAPSATTGTSARWQPLAAAGSVIALLAGMSVLNPRPVVDEVLHVAVIERFAGGDWRWPDELPMPPAYHALAALIARALGDPLLAARATSALCTLAIIALAADLRRWQSPRGHTDLPLHVVWCPAFFPLAALGYTDAAGLLGVVAAAWCHERGQRPAAAACLLVATCVRQSNAVWIALFLAWTTLEAWRAGPARRAGPAARPLPLAGRRLARLLDAPHAARRALWRTLAAGWPYLLAGLPAAVVLVQLESTALGRQWLNAARFNPAQFYLFGLAAGAMLLPIWGDELRRRWLGSYRPTLGHAWVWALAVATVALLALRFVNPHPWNRERWVLSNVPLLLIERSPLLLLLGSAALTLWLALAAGFTAVQPRRGRLALLWVFIALFLAPHWAACVRYDIVPLALLSLQAVYAPTAGRVLTIWMATASAALTGLLLLAGNEAFGVW